jgi:hypothetical protein
MRASSSTVRWAPAALSPLCAATLSPLMVSTPHRPSSSLGRAVRPPRQTEGSLISYTNIISHFCRVGQCLIDCPRFSLFGLSGPKYPSSFICSTAFSNLFIRTHTLTMYERNLNTYSTFGGNVIRTSYHHNIHAAVGASPWYFGRSPALMWSIRT